MSSFNLLDSANQFVSWDPNETTKQELQNLLLSSSSSPADVQEKALKPLFGKRIAFGTAGLRAGMGPGYSRMNDLIILQTSQGLVSYLSDQLGEEAAQKRGIVIGYDHRKAAGTLIPLSNKRKATCFHQASTNIENQFISLLILTDFYHAFFICFILTFAI